MIKLNRTTEYGLMALRHMSRKRANAGTGTCAFTSAREVSDLFGLPFEITAKTLQRMKDTGLIQSAQGARGGYVLDRPLTEINLAEFLELMEGPQAVVACAQPSHKTSYKNGQKQVPSAIGSEVATASLNRNGELPVLHAVPNLNRECEYQTKCEMKSPLGILNSRFITFLSGICLAEITDDIGFPQVSFQDKRQQNGKESEKQINEDIQLQDDKNLGAL